MDVLSGLQPGAVAALQTLILAYLRIQAVILVLPAFSERFVTVRVRVSLAVALTPAADAFGMTSDTTAQTGLGLFAALAAREMLVGLLIAIPVRIMASALHVATSAIGATASLSQLIGTGTEAAPHPIGNLMHMAGLAMLMAMGLPILMIELIAQSYIAFPGARLTMGAGELQGFIGLVARSFVLAMTLASPFILGGLLYQLLTGVVNKVMPSLPVVFIGAPAIILMALVGLAVLAPSIIELWTRAVLTPGLRL